MNSLTHQPPSYRWVILLIATFAQMTACFLVQGLGAIAGYLQKDLLLTGLQIGLLISAAQLVPLFGLLIAGELLDRFNERWVIGFGTLIVALALCASVLADSYAAVLSFLLLLGAGYSTSQPGGSKSVSGWFPPSQRGFAMGIRQAGLPLGGALATLTLPAVASSWGWRAAFLTGGVVALAGALVFMLFYRSAPRIAPVARHKEPLIGLLMAKFAMVKEPAMNQIMLSGVSLVSVQYGILVFTVLYLYEALQMSLQQGATMLFLAQGAGVAGRIVLAAWSDRCRAGRNIPVLVCMVAVIAGFLFLITLPTHNLWFVGGVCTWLGFFGFGWYGPWVAFVAESAPTHQTGFALGLAMAVNQIATVLVTPFLGWLRDTTHGYTTGWAFLIALVLLALMLIVRKYQSKK